MASTTASAALPADPAADAGKAEKPPSPLRAKRRRQLAQWGFIAPAVLFMALFFGYPLVRNIVMSFQDYSPSTFFTGEAPFNGLDNWRNVFDDGLFGKALWQTVLFTVGSLAGQFCIGLALAVFFSRRFPLNGILRSLILLPWLVPMVVSGIVWRRIFDQDTGVLNSFLGTLGLGGDTPWLTSTSMALVSVILVNIWIGIPFNMVILYGGLQEVPKELHEAAALDGASAWRTFRSVTLPVLKPVITVVLVLGFMSTVKILDLVLALTDGGPADSTQTLGTLTYQNSFVQMDFGAGAVVGNVLILISAVFAVFYLRANRNEGK
ncbi:carbohydrate ABC transporter permease [Streptomyces halstedii]|uniref:carbohydrate ABC transporter permease n=1 Tax=Streptomyces TaxID=1883 RepID=UPI00048C3B74|nr:MULTISPECIES: sugar ABC transporter permease [Streptomyces]KDQ70274.1 ABC transporter permease [Streptomyces sp. NTK 937]MYR72641.1 ABC transporter permease subunit [Streptomyces sp. SID4925]MYY19552.1 ABC transporter permease subunit [Streptomyces sp. SID4912]SBU95002.1 multiple sugar transport system permease protein [Streptomyces sp. OspMP-M45]SCD47649.1 carbohydrate ABC transporter membrane protein 1, CUT1 family [Streptomyces sp. DpondAA-D4]